MIKIHSKQTIFTEVRLFLLLY